ncbi:3-hydroxyacyl-CoA dehydrogenase NAD-binding domain-containing protein [Algivirga pacifica]|uniref:3-hydroxyacyl-CoA dehydrogenase NAD-binding domain-containing protein n=1 Tax=Algivirga pacifica TaxID=1162670 RepID=A0ABP9D7T8_9BACT
MITSQLDSQGILTLTLNDVKAPVNTLGEQMLVHFKTALTQVTEETCKGVIITSSKKDFLVGADIKAALANRSLFLELVKEFKQLYRQLETCGKPVVAAINGTVLGGGYELCLACHHRIALKNKNIKIGLPEVGLGLLPGAGGTLRLPRLIGIEKAMTPLLTGTNYSPQEALELGLVDELVEDLDTLLAKAKSWIAEHEGVEQPWDQKGYTLPGGTVDRPEIGMTLLGTSGNILKKTYGNYISPKAILNAVYEGVQLPFDQASLVEDRYFKQCVLSDAARNMMRTFFVSRQKIKARREGVDHSIQCIGIIGAGLMGSGIAYAAASKGIRVLLKDISLEKAHQGKSYTERILKKRIVKGESTASEVEGILENIQTVSTYEDFKACDLVIEAVVEERSVKGQVIQEVQQYLRKDALLASNTSTLPIAGLSTNSLQPKNFIGLHFFSPVEKMTLVEIIKAKETSLECVHRCIDFVKSLGKLPIVVRDNRGFYTSRVFSTYITEGLYCILEGVRPALLENAGEISGMPMGPLEIADAVGLDLVCHIHQQVHQDTGEEYSEVYDVVRLLVEDLDRTGKKAGKGFYEYPEEGEKYLWKEMETYFPAIIQQPSVEALKERLLIIQALETVRCLEEGIIKNIEDADVGSVLGWGFPAYTGGVISYIDTMGVATFVRKCQELQEVYGERFKPTIGLKEMAVHQVTFYPQLAEEEVSFNEE